MAAGTLVVKIAADISDFSRNLDAAEKRLLKAGDRLEKVGADLSLKVTAPLLALSAAFAKSAADDAASVEKMGRAFGAATGQMDSFIKSLMKSVPATDDQLRTLASSTDTLFKSMGIAPQKAMAMSQSVLKLAGDLAAYNHVSLESATDTIEKAMAGRTRGLVELNVAVSDADVKAKAYQMGLAKVGDELSSTAKAQATLAAIIERSGAQQGEAARTFNNNENALARLKQAADGVADSFGAVVLPTFVHVADAAKTMADRLAALDPSTKGAIVGVLAVTAAIGPLIYIGGSLVKVFTLARAALMGLVATEALSGLGAMLMSVTSLGEAVTALGIAGGALATAFAPLVVGVMAVGGIGYLFNKSGEEARKATADVDAFRVALGNLSTAAEAQAKAREVAAKLAQLPTAPVRGYGNSVAAGLGYAMPSLAGFFQTDDAFATQRAALQQQLIAANARTRALSAPAGKVIPPGATGDNGGKDPFASLEEYANRLGRVYELTNAKGKPLVGLTGQITLTIDALTAALGRQKNQWSETAVKIREALESLTKFGQATLLPGLQGKLPSLTYAQAVAQMGNAGAGVPGLNTNLRNITAADVRGPAGSNVAASALAPPLLQQVTLQQRMVAQLELLPGQFANTLGQYLGPVIARMGGGAGGAIGASLGGGIGGAIGTALVPSGLGKVAGAIVGSTVPIIGTIVGSLAGGLIGGALGHLFGGGGPSPAEKAANQLNALAAAAQKVQEAISGLPEGVKIASYRFDATAPAPPDRPGGTGKTGGGTSTGGDAGNAKAGGTSGSSGTPSSATGGGKDGGSSKSFNFAPGSVVVHGATDAATLFRMISDFAEGQTGRGGVTGLQLAAG